MTAEQAKAMVEASLHPPVLEAWEQLRAGTPALRLRQNLEQHYPPATCRALLDCLQSRVRFQSKFENSQAWCLQGEAAEQATPSIVAQWRLEFLRQRCPVNLNLTEVGCGLGGDTVYLSHEFPGVSFEMDPARAILAEANIANLGRAGGWQVKCEEVEPSEIRAELLFCDPGRRGHRREFDPEQWSPPLSSLVRQFQEGKVARMGLKCAPGLKAWPQACQAHFISVRGELKEAFLWFDADSHSQADTAWLLGDEQQSWSDGGAPTQSVPTPGQYLHNPDPAILRAGAVAHLAERLQAGVVHPKIGYLVGPHPCSGPAAASFLIDEVFPLNWKHLSARLKAQDWADYEYLGRGVPFSQPEVRKRLSKAAKALKVAGHGRGSIIVYRAQGDYQVVLGTRVASKGKDFPGCE